MDEFTEMVSEYSDVQIKVLDQTRKSAGQIARTRYMRHYLAERGNLRVQKSQT